MTATVPTTAIPRLLCYDPIMRKLQALTQEALHLPLEDRARLAERLLESLDDLSERELEKVWGEEAVSRVEAYEAGLIDALPAEEVHEEIRRVLR